MSLRQTWLGTALLLGAGGPPQDVKSALAEGRYDEALATLQRDWETTPGAESQKKLLEAGLLNRLGRHPEALAGADAALAASADLPPQVAADAHLERGAALAGLKEFPRAAEALQASLDGGTSRPGEARALLGLSLASLERLPEAREQFARAEEELQEDSLLYESARQWRRHLDGLAAREGDEPLGARVRFGAGHSSNPLRFNTDAQLPGGVAGRGSFFYETDLNAWWDPFDDGETKLRLSATPNVRWYDRAQGFSKLGTRLSAQATHKATEELSFGGGFAWDVAWLLEPRRKLSRAYEPSLFAEYRWNRDHATKLSLSHALTTYYLSGLSGPLDPDGAATQLRLEHVVALDPEQRYVLVGALGHAWNRAGGSDWDFDARDASVALAARPLDPLTLTAGVFAAWYEFTSPNSLSPTGRERRDEILVPFVSATWKITDWCGVTASFSHSSVESNVAVFEYDESQWSLLPYVDVMGLVGSAIDEVTK